MDLNTRFKLWSEDPTAVFMSLTLVIYFSYFGYGVLAEKFESIKPWGMVIFVLGVAAGYFAKKTLAENWSPSVKIKQGEKKTLLTKGFYGVVRHPMYSSLFIMMAGLCSYSYDLILALLCVPVITAVVIRMNKEEKELEKYFGESYSEYIKKTKKVVPFVY